MKKAIAVLVGFAVVLAASSAWAGWAYLAPVPAVVYRPVLPYYSYAPVVPVAPAPVVTVSPVVAPPAVVSPGAVIYPAPAVVVPARVYYRPVRPYRAWLIY